MNQTDRDILILVITNLRTIKTPYNPADIKVHVQNLKRAEKIAKNAANVIENCGYGDYDLAKEEIEENFKPLSCVKKVPR